MGAHMREAAAAGLRNRVRTRPQMVPGMPVGWWKPGGECGKIYLDIKIIYGTNL